MTNEKPPELLAAHRDGQTITLTYTRLDGLTATSSVAAPVLHGFDAQVRNPIRLLTLYPEGQLPT